MTNRWFAENLGQLADKTHLGGLIDEEADLSSKSNTYINLIAVYILAKAGGQAR